MCTCSSTLVFPAERLLPSHRAVPAPFTQEECQELTALIRSFGGIYFQNFSYSHNHTQMGLQMTAKMTTAFKRVLSLEFFLESVSYFCLNSCFKRFQL